MRMYNSMSKMIFIIVGSLFLSMCVPPDGDGSGKDSASSKEIDSLRALKCPRYMSSAAELYRSQDWQGTVEMYSQINTLGCDKWDPIMAPPQEIYLYWAIAYEQMAKFDSTEFVLLKGLQLLPESVDLRKRLAYTYKRLGQTEKQGIEYERIHELAPDNIDNLHSLSEYYNEMNQCEDQIFILREILDIEENNEVIQGELAIAYEKCGKDPLDIYGERHLQNPANISYGIDYANRLLNADRPQEAAKVLVGIIELDPRSKLAYRKLGEAYYKSNDLEEASRSYEELFNLYPRDWQTAIKISDINIEFQDFGKAIRWADKGLQAARNTDNAKYAIAQKGNVFYKAFQSCRSTDISDDDRIVASMAYNYFKTVEEMGIRRYTQSSNWLEENEVLFGKANWFMLTPNQKSKGSITTNSECYNWISESLKKDPEW